MALGIYYRVNGAPSKRGGCAWRRAARSGGNLAAAPEWQKGSIFRSARAAAIAPRGQRRAALDAWLSRHACA
jgi:hypothetical protein